MIRRPPRSTRTDTLFPSTTLFRSDGGILTVSTSPSLAVKWLIPRLGRFYQGHPEVDLRIRPDPAVVDLQAEADSIDMAIRFGQDGFPGLAATPFMHETVFAVASPELLAKGPPLRHPRALAQHTMLPHPSVHLQVTSNRQSTRLNSSH